MIARLAYLASPLSCPQLLGLPALGGSPWSVSVVSLCNLRSCKPAACCGRQVRVQQVRISMRALLQSLLAGEVWAAAGGCQGADGSRCLALPSLL